MIKTNEPTEAQIVASIINGTGKSETVASMRTISARVIVTTLARVDAMAQKAGKSRNEMLNMLLDVACNEVYNNLESDVIQELQAREMAALQASLAVEE
jgi:hypothetical protein